MNSPKSGRFADKILLTDLDGTLLNSQGVISPRNAEALTLFTAEGGRFGIATGRGAENALRYVSGVSVNFPSIFLNGALLYDYKARRALKVYTLDKPAVLPLLEKCLGELPDVGIQIYTDETGYFVSLESRTDKDFIDQHIPYGFTNIQSVSHLLWAKVIFNADPEQRAWLERETEPLVRSGVVTTVLSGETYFELTPHGVTKGRLITHIKRELAQGATVYAAGNYYNDVEMIKAADVGVFTANTPEELKPLAAVISADCDSDAIADVVLRIMNTNK